MPPKGWKSPFKGVRHFKTHCVHGHDLALVGRTKRSCCRRCERDRKKRHYSIPINRERWHYRMRRNHFKRAYGITLEQRDQMVTNQAGRCAICTDLFTGVVHVDHDHKTGALRGILCPTCNQQLGRLENIEWVIKAQAYLGIWSATRNPEE